MELFLCWNFSAVISADGYPVGGCFVSGVALWCLWPHFFIYRISAIQCKAAMVGETSWRPGTVQYVTSRQLR